MPSRIQAPSSLQYAIVLCASFAQVYKAAAVGLAIRTVLWVEGAKRQKGAESWKKKTSQQCQTPQKT